jgi:hypothetical protein
MCAARLKLRLVPKLLGLQAAGKSTKDRLEEMLDNACFAFLVLTAEDELADGSKHARQNVIQAIMGAREKLNGAFFTGSLFLAAAAGSLADSWAVFFIGLTILVAANFCTGEIRPSKRRG